MNPAPYSMTTRAEFLLLERGGEGRSLTNDAEAVIAQLAGRGVLEGRRVLYQDTEGRWDEMRHEAGRFRGFAPLGARTAEDAVAGARREVVVRMADLAVLIPFPLSSSGRDAVAEVADEVGGRVVTEGALQAVVCKSAQDVRFAAARLGADLDCGVQVRLGRPGRGEEDPFDRG